MVHLFCMTSCTEELRKKYNPHYLRPYGTEEQPKHLHD